MIGNLINNLIIAIAKANGPPQATKITLGLPNPLKYNTIPDLINGILGYLVIIAAPICALLVLVGGFQLMTAGGNVEKVAIGRKTIIYAAVGYAIILVSYGLSSVIKNILGVQ